MRPRSRSKAICYGFCSRDTKVRFMPAYYLVDFQEIKDIAKMLFFQR
jgi:hypothetical protein